MEAALSIGRKSGSSSTTFNGQEYQRLINSEENEKEPKMSTKLSPSGFLKAPKKAPKGHLPVYVGQERKRFVVRIDCLSHPLFKDLLDHKDLLDYRTLDGFERVGGLEVECEPDVFEQLIRVVDSERTSSKRKHF